MAQQTKISWCDSTVNFWSGCTRVSAGCAHCYAEEQGKRFPTFGKWGPNAERRLHESAFTLAKRLNRKPWVCDTCGTAETIGCPVCGPAWQKNRRRRIFSLSLGDWLDPEVPVEWLARMLDTVRQCDKVTWILCTKRPEYFQRRLFMAWSHCGAETASWVQAWAGGSPPQNICLLASVENQEAAEKRIPELLRIPARWRGLSLEPLLGPVDLSRVRWQTQDDHHGKPQPDHFENVLIGGGKVDVPFVNWLIIGGESGPKARPCNVEWIRSLVRQGQAAGTATFVKQLGRHPILTEADKEVCWLPDENGHEGFSDREGRDLAEWPEDLRIQKWPEGL